MSRMCSQCGKNNGHNSRTCSEAGSSRAAADGSAVISSNAGIMLFGVRLTEGSSFRKSASMTNLAQFDQPQPHDSNPDVAAGYASDDIVHDSVRNRDRKRGVPWTEEEHKLFLLGLQKVGKGDWRGISRNFVKTRTPTQVASHAQKYFLRRNNHNRRRRRSSLFDITADTFVDSAMEEDRIQQDISTSQSRFNSNLKGFPVSVFPQILTPVVLPVTGDRHKAEAAQSSSINLIRPIPFPPSSEMAELNLNQSPTVDSLPFPLNLNLKLSVSSMEPAPSDQNSQPTTRHSPAFEAMSGSFNSSSGGESIISVA